MTIRLMAELVFLAALWGASFLFIRVSVVEFGPEPLVFLRVGIAALFLLPLCLLRKEGPQLVRFWPQLTILGAINSALPFLFLSWAAARVPAGFLAVMNATAPLFAALIGWIWLGIRLTAGQVIGLFTGFFGVCILVYGKLDFAAPGAILIPAAAALCATVLYGLAANYTRRYAQGISSLTIATGGQLAATLIVTLPAILNWPETMPSSGSWACAFALALFSTALGFLIYYRLINLVGPTKAIAVTFLVPVFGMLWGRIFLFEPISVSMVSGTLVILLGTSMVTGWIKILATNSK